MTRIPAWPLYRLFMFTMTAVSPSSARALASGPASRARPDGEPRGELEAECLRVGVVAADECVLVGRLLGAEARRRERVEARDDRGGDFRLDALGERERLRRREHAVLREPELRGDRENGRFADRVPKLARGVERRLGVDGEHDEVGVRARLAVRLADAVDLERGGGRALGIPRADDHVETRRVEPCCERPAERARPTDHGYAHAASRTASASRRSDVDVPHHGFCNEELDASGRGSIGLVDHEQVDETVVARRDVARTGASCHAGEHTTERAGDGRPSDERAHRQGPHLPAPDRGPDLRNREDRADRQVGVARREEDRVGVGERLEDAGRRGRGVGSLVLDRIDLVLVAAADEPLLKREPPGRGRDVRPQPVVGRRDDARGQPGAPAEIRRDRRQPGPAPQRLGADEVETDVAVAQPEPVGAAPSSGRLERVPALPGATPASLGVDQPAERVQEAVEIGRDVQPEDLEVVADVADDGQLPGRQDGGESTCEASSAATARRAGRPSRGNGEERACARAEASAEPIEVGVRVDVQLELRDPDGRQAGVSSEASGASRAVERRKDARIGEGERVRRSIGGLDQRRPGLGEPAKGSRASPPEGRRSRRAHARRRRRARPRRPPRALLRDRPRPRRPEARPTRRPSRRGHVRPATAASTTSPSIARASAARRDDARRRFESPRYGMTIAGTRRSVVRRRSRRIRSNPGRTSPTRGRRTSACHEVPRPRRDRCARG